MPLPAIPSSADPRAADLQAVHPQASDPLLIDGVALDSRFFLGTAGYPSPATLCDAIRASGSQLLTVGLKRTLQAGDNGALAQALRAREAALRQGPASGAGGNAALPPGGFLSPGGI